MAVREIVTLRIDPADASAFEAAVARAVPLFRDAPGCRSMTLERSIEQPGSYLLVVGWESVEAHMTGFRGSEAFGRWRALVGPFLIAPPEVEHVERVVTGF